MSWSSALYKTYDNCAGAVSIDPEHVNAIPLAPLYHTLKTIEYEIAINDEGNFMPGYSKPIKEDVIIPSTESAEGRTSTIISPFPLFDDLKYMAGDYDDFSTDKKYKKHFCTYIEQLNKWCNSEYAVPGVMAICKYLAKGTLLHDMVTDGLFEPDENGIIDQSKLKHRVRIVVKSLIVDDFTAWTSRETWNSFISYIIKNQNGNKDFCYISGQYEALTANHPKIVGNAKLISSNQDSKGYIVNAGVFAGASNAVAVSYEASQKIHTALKWLIERQGFYVGDQLWLAFGTNQPDVPSIDNDSYDIISKWDSTDEKASQTIDTKEVFALKLNHAIEGYNQKLKGYQDIIIFGANAATPGRLSIIYYQEIASNDFLQRIEFWHKTCTWKHTYKSVYKESKKQEYITYYGAPALMDIIKAIYGEKVSDHLKKATFERLVPCITESSPIPLDIMLSISRRAGNPVSMEPWEYRKMLTIACAIIKKYYNDRHNLIKNNKTINEDYEEVWKMALDKPSNERDYLFGRWLAYAQKVESYAMYVSGNESRMTNAERLMHQFSMKPRKTLEIINNQLTYYFKKLGENGLSHEWKTAMNDLLDRLGKENFTDKKLTELYILGYASQMSEFEKEIEENKEKNKK